MVDPTTGNQDVGDSDERPTKRARRVESNNEATSGRSKMFYNEPNEITIPEDLLEFLTATFTKSLYKEVWTQLLDKYPSIIGTENVLVSPTIEIGMKEDIKRKHGYMKSK